MDIILEKLISTASVFLVLSLAVEKITEYIKLRKKELRVKPSGKDAEKEREKSILARGLLIGILVALFLKADSIQMLVSGEPGEVIGWENVVLYDEVQIDELTPANYYYFKALTFNDASFGEFLFRWIQAVIGILITGVALSFGSKFWHDIVGILYEVKEAKAKASGRR